MQNLNAVQGLALASVLVLFPAAGGPAHAQSPVAAGTWYFAVSGDSRDCGGVSSVDPVRSVQSSPA